MKIGQVLQKLKLEIQVKDVVLIGLYLSFQEQKVDYKGRKLYHLDMSQRCKNNCVIIIAILHCTYVIAIGIKDTARMTQFEYIMRTPRYMSL
jgi:hypothetical protein